jgi:hypothetical protein
LFVLSPQNTTPAAAAAVHNTSDLALAVIVRNHVIKTG